MNSDTILELAKEKAEENMDSENPIVVIVTYNGEEVSLTNPWRDRTGRFKLTDEEAVREYGLGAILLFFNRITLRNVDIVLKRLSERSEKYDSNHSE